MYALLLICAMAIGQEATKDTSAPSENNVSSFQLAKEHLVAFESISKELDLRGKIDIQKNEDGKTVTISGERTKIIRLRNAFELRGMWEPAKTANEEPEKIEMEFGIVKERIEELHVLMPKIHDQKIVYEVDTEEGVVKVKGISAEVERVRAALDDRRLLSARIITTTRQLKFATAKEIANILTQLDIKHTKIIPDERPNLLVLVGHPDDLKLVDNRINELDVQAQQPAPTSPGSPSDEIIQIINTTTDKMSSINAVFETELTTVQIEPGEAKNTIKVQGRRSDVEKAIKLLTDRGFVAKGRSMRVFQLQHADANSIAQTLNQLKMPNVTIVAEAQTNSVIATGSNGDINIVEALLSNLDIKSASEPKKTPDTNAQDSQSRTTYVYRLVNKPAAEVASAINQMEIEGVKLTAEELRNSVIIQAAKKELKLVIGIIQALDMKVFPTNETTQAAPNPAIGALWTDFAKAEAKSIATAGELRIAAAKFGNEHPTMRELRTRLETEVKIAFDLRHKLQQAEAAELRRQLTEIESRLTKREKNKPAIIEARVNSLLNMDDLGWEAMTKPKGPSLNREPNNPNPLTPNSEAAGLALTGKNKELAEAWERVDRDEYIPVKIPSNFGGMGMGGFGGMGGMGGGFPGGPATAVAPAPVVPQYQQGVLIGGNAMIRDSYGLVGDQVVWFGAKQLPCRLAAVAPFSIFCYRSARFPSQGVTDFTHKPNNDEQVWAFVPDQMNTLVKAKVFRKSGAEFAIDEKTSFGIEAEGKIETGYIVCNDQGDFLGIVSNNYGSLGACWSAPAIGDWLKRTNLEEPTPKNPLDGRVIIALPGSDYVKEPEKSFEINNEGAQPDRAFYGSIIKGVIVTHPEVSKADLANSGKILYGGRALTCDKMKLTENGRFTIIWCKELTPESGFITTHPMIVAKESAVPLGTRATSVQSYEGKSKTTHVLQPISDETPDFQSALSRRAVVSKADKTSFEINWLGIYNSIGLPVVTTGGHFLGIIDDDKPISITTSEELRNVSEHHTVHVISAEEIFQFVDEETRKSTSSAEVTRSPGTASPSDSKTKIEPEVARREAANEFNKRIQEPEAAIVVSVDHYQPGDSKTPPKRYRGSIVNGCIFISELIHDEEYIQVDSKSLPQRLAGITPGGLYVYHRERLPSGFTKFGQSPKKGDQVWTVTPLGGGRNTNINAQVIGPSNTTREMGANDNFMFAIESDFKAEPGTVVLNDNGELIGIVVRSRGSLSICEHIASAMDYVKRIDLSAPQPADRVESMVWLLKKETQERWQGLIVRGVLVTHPDLFDQDFSKLTVQIGSNRGLTLKKRYGVKSLNDKLALIWCDEIKPEQGIRSFRPATIEGDFAFASSMNSSWGGMSGVGGVPLDLFNKNQIKAAPGANGSQLAAARITTIRDHDFDLYWYGQTGVTGDAVFDPGSHLLGINVSKSAAVGETTGTTVMKAAEVFRAIEEESKKLPPAATPEKPAETLPEKPKTESPMPEPPK